VSHYPLATTGEVTHLKYQGHTAPEFAVFVALAIDEVK
jgi:hypothetical protein